MPKFSIIDAPSILGLRPTGVEHLPEALKGAGLLEKLNAEYKGNVLTLPYNPVRDETTQILNPNAIKIFSLRLAEAVYEILSDKNFPIVLGGDCSILIGSLLALKRLGGYGLFFIDGHADFYQPTASPTGEVADMDLAIISGRGPDILTNIDNSRPLIQDENIVIFGCRDAEQAAIDGSQNVRDTDILVFDLAQIQNLGVKSIASQAVEELLKKDISGFWIHLDVDVLNDEIMPAVDYRLEGGLNFSDLSELLKILLSSGCAVGMDITIFNPSLDKDGSIAHQLVSSIVAGLSDFVV
ncbi:MAG TPA: arginase family protein [Leptolyngbyaceae cyanobacterium]